MTEPEHLKDRSIEDRIMAAEARGRIEGAHEAREELTKWQTVLWHVLKRTGPMELDYRDLNAPPNIGNSLCVDRREERCSILVSAYD